MPFEASVHGDFQRMDVGRQLTELVTDKLVNPGEFDVVERSRIAAVLDEQDFGASGARQSEPCGGAGPAAGRASVGLRLGEPL